MKKTIATILVFVFVICVCFSTTNTDAASKISKYTKIKTTTLVKYKKAYRENKTLKAEIKKLKENNAKLKSELKTKNEDLSSANSINSWVWMNLKSMGITYNKKVWTIPSEFPEKYIIDGATYIIERSTTNDQ